MKARHAAVLERLRSAASVHAPVPSTPQAPLAADGARTATAEDHHGHARTLRVTVETLDRILDLTGEIAVGRGRLAQVLESGGGTHPVCPNVYAFTRP